MNIPIVGAHFLLSEGDLPREKIPDTWSLIRFDTVDLLYVSPSIVFIGGKAPLFRCMGLAPDRTIVDLSTRFRWVVNRARSQKPNLKIIAMQMPQENNDFSVLKTPKLIDDYTSSVRDFLAQWQNEKSIENPNRSLRVDGYDVDYEWDNFQRPGDGNLQPYAPTILSQVSKKLDALSKSPPYYVSITPASKIGLDGPAEGKPLAKILDYVNMQRYDGGWPIAADYISAIPGLARAKVTWGISSERPSKNHNASSIDDVIKRIMDGDYTGAIGGMAPKLRQLGI